MKPVQSRFIKQSHDMQQAWEQHLVPRLAAYRLSK